MSGGILAYLRRRLREALLLKLLLHELFRIGVGVLVTALGKGVMTGLGEGPVWIFVPHIVIGCLHNLLGLKSHAYAATH